jgi:hypothetical protein
VTGPYVYDSNHGWNEIHPVWRISSASAPAGGSTATTVTPTPTTKASPAQAKGAHASLFIISVTSPVDPGAGASLVAQTLPHAACSLAVTLPSGRQSGAQGLGPGTADASGRVQWTWETGNRTKAGTARATVTCGSSSATTTFQFTE